MIDHTVDTQSRASDGRRPIVVLLVDDQPFVGAAVSLLLASEPDIELHCCVWAVNAIALANQIAPAIVLQDLVMPEIDGLTLLRSFQANPLTAGTPVVVLSGNDDAATRARAMAAGATGYLVKLPPKAELIACIREHASPGTGGSDTLDLAAIDRFRAAPDFTRRLIDQFILEAGACVQTLREATGRADTLAMKGAAHKLKGSSLIMGATQLAALCAQVEADPAASTGAATMVVMTEIDQEFVRVEHALAVHREGTVQR